MSKKDIEASKNTENAVESNYRRKSNKMPVLTKKERKKDGIGNDKAHAVAKYIRIAPRKVRIVMDLIRNKNVNEAFGILKYTQKAASPVLNKVLKSAVANAENKALDVDDLYIAEAFADQGPTLKRIRARAQGRAARILKKTSHITLVVRERE